MTNTARNPRAEAQATLGDGHRATVLEPSPPAVTDEPFFADDPVAPADGSGPVVLPAGVGAEVDWNTIVGERPDLAEWAAERWLGGPRRLPALPASHVETRLALHRLAAYVIAPVRHTANGKFGLRWTMGGFGTPFFPGPDGEDRQVRVDGDQLIDQRGDDVRATTITTLRAAAEFLESEIDPDTAAEHDSPELGDIDETLAVDAEASRFFGQWYGMAVAALEAVRADGASVDPSRPQLWPGHLDPAIEVGDEDHRGSYGASPGDPGVPEPYLYLSIWWPDRIGVDADDPAWNAPSFTGAVLKLSDFPTDEDPVTVATRFWLEARDRLG